ncbi:MAG: fumarate hydratase [Clostridiales bacterium]|jgi:fumarate hydratase subunit alpha|nr:fumarate hydratase [Clostridiales bacterium]
MRREIDASAVTEAVARLCAEANYNLGTDVRTALERCAAREGNPRGLRVLESILENADIAKREQTAICQDTGMSVVFVTLGRDAYVNGNIEAAVNEGVRLGYDRGCLRKSVVGDPLRRRNTGDNTPAVIHYEMTEGDGVELTVAPKGFGSENMSALKMLKPSDGGAGVMDFVVETVRSAGGNPCPPVVVGVGIGGTMEKAAYLAKKALLRDVDGANPDPYYADMEAALLERINALNIGPMGWGGRATALGVNILTYPTHIAGLPAAVNVSCHVTRHASAIL